MPHASEESTDALTVLRSTWDTPGPDLESLNLSSVMTAGSGNDMSAVRKLISLDSLLANNKNGRLKDLGDVYHDISLVSSSLLTDSKFGGLKKDLNIMFSQEKLPEEFRGDTADIGLRPYTSEDGNPSDQNRPIGSWNQLYLWANVWDSSTKREGQDASATLQWNGSAPSTLIAADSAASMEMMDNRYTYMRHPILLRFYSFVGLNYVKHGNKHPNRGGWIDFRIAVIPVYVWWNPYNVDMKLTGANGGVWGAYFGEHRFMPLLLSHNVKFAWNQLDENALSNYGESCLIPYLNASYNNRQVADFGASFRTTAKLNSDGSTVKGEPSTLKAGEIVVFAQPVVSNIANGNEVYKTKPNSGDFKPDRFPLKEGWSQEPGQVSSYAVNLTDGVRYELLDGSGYNQVGIAKASVIFAEDTSRLNGTPDNHVLAVKYGDKGASKALGTFVMGAGLMDPNKMNSSSSLNGKSTAEIEIFSKTMPAILNLNWGAWEKPLVDQIKLPAEMWERNEGTNEEAKKAGEYGTPSLDSTFVAYYGVSVKWGKPPVIGAYPEGKDYRAKTWQHSSPLFWGGQMPTASELGRLYSPYQFEVKNANSDFFPITISNILSNDGTVGSPRRAGEPSRSTRLSPRELPSSSPPARRLLPDAASPRMGTGATRAAIAKRFAYQSGVPGVGIGNLFADPMLPADKVFSHNEIMGDAALGDFWDHGLMINDALWDSWFASSLAARPSSLGGTGREELKTVLQQAFSTDASSNRASGIANRRFMPDLQGKPSKLSSKNHPRRTKATSMFQRTSPSPEDSMSTPPPSAPGKPPCWGSRSAGFSIPGAAGPPCSTTPRRPFPVSGVASDKSHVDDYGSIGVTQGIPDGEAMAWSDLRTLSDTQIRSLARNMVKEVKKRGPFLNMSDFVNRRLQSGEMGVKGALQAAIDESSINSTFDELSDMVIAPKGGYPNQDAARGSVYTAAPGYLIQSDVLAVLGNILTTRDDTFTVRAYGELANREGVVLSRAWCEAVVQRGINYVDPVDSPKTSGPAGQHEERRAGGYRPERREQGVWKKVQHRFLPLAVPRRSVAEGTCFHSVSRRFPFPGKRRFCVREKVFRRTRWTGSALPQDFYHNLFSLAHLLPFMYFTRDKSPSGPCHRAPLRGPIPMPFRISSVRLSAKGLCNVSKLFPFPRTRIYAYFTHPRPFLPAFFEAFPSPKDRAAPQAGTGPAGSKCSGGRYRGQVPCRQPPSTASGSF